MSRSTPFEGQCPGASALRALRGQQCLAGVRGDGLQLSLAPPGSSPPEPSPGHAPGPSGPGLVNIPARIASSAPDPASRGLALATKIRAALRRRTPATASGIENQSASRSTARTATTVEQHRQRGRLLPRARNQLTRRFQNHDPARTRVGGLRFSDPLAGGTSGLSHSAGAAVDVNGGARPDLVVLEQPLIGRPPGSNRPTSRASSLAVTYSWWRDSARTMSRSASVIRTSTARSRSNA